MRTYLIKESTPQGVNIFVVNAENKEKALECIDQTELSEIEIFMIDTSIDGIALTFLY